MSEPVSIRRARPDDVDFLLELITHEDVDPFMGAQAARDRKGLLAEIERSEREPHEFGRFVIEAGGERVGSLGFHRLQLEIYGFNQRAVAHAERGGFVREGVRRKAYLRHGGYVDAVLFGLVREDLEGG